MFEYKETFLDKIKVLFPYFIEFSKDGSILPKNYSKNCVVSKSNKKPIIMIIYNKSNFFANDR